MKVNVNGVVTDVQEGATIMDFIRQKGLTPNTVVVEHNLKIVPQEVWDSVRLVAKDQLQIVSFVGGG